MIVNNVSALYMLIVAVSLRSFYQGRSLAKIMRSPHKKTRARYEANPCFKILTEG
tara:strand:- start:35794 stop:35958 length:165 start_codon:yes stop_codon:yes gene_type:complete